ncbi:hypothetical protein Tco_0878157 [Tanacetum coccineum]|uniref:Reverse transcriptase zinc-binding domain-containing protein n=1 Tax=Tanacetum coccineum TaxID=301880 RepID=A0ABQ5BXK4_9ASTR
MDVVIKEGVDPNFKLKDMIKDDSWRWTAVLQNNSVLNSILVPKLSNGVKDTFLWNTKDGNTVNYSTNKAWEDWRSTSDKEIWSKMKTIVDINYMPDKWEDIANFMSMKKHNKSIKSVLVRVILASCVCFIWIERNKRHFTSEKQSCKDLNDNVVYYIRLKLASLTMKRTEHVEEISRKWKVVFNVWNEDDGDHPASCFPSECTAIWFGMLDMAWISYSMYWFEGNVAKWDVSLSNSYSRVIPSNGIIALGDGSQ